MAGFINRALIRGLCETLDKMRVFSKTFTYLKGLIAKVAILHTCTVAIICWTVNWSTDNVHIKWQNIHLFRKFKEPKYRKTDGAGSDSLERLTIIYFNTSFAPASSCSNRRSLFSL